MATKIWFSAGKLSAVRHEAKLAVHCVFWKSQEEARFGIERGDPRQ